MAGRQEVSSQSSWVACGEADQVAPLLDLPCVPVEGGALVRPHFACLPLGLPLASPGTPLAAGVAQVGVFAFARVALLAALVAFARVAFPAGALLALLALLAALVAAFAAGVARA